MTIESTGEFLEAPLTLRIVPNNPPTHNVVNVRSEIASVGLGLEAPHSWSGVRVLVQNDSSKSIRAVEFESLSGTQHEAWVDPLAPGESRRVGLGGFSVGHFGVLVDTGKGWFPDPEATVTVRLTTVEFDDCTCVGDCEEFDPGSGCLVQAVNGS